MYKPDDICGNCGLKFSNHFGTRFYGSRHTVAANRMLGIQKQSYYCPPNCTSSFVKLPDTLKSIPAASKTTTTDWLEWSEKNYKKQQANLPVINDHVCPSCKNDRVSKTEKSCWKCGNPL